MRTTREIATAMQGMTLADMQNLEENIRTQQRRKRNLKKLTDIFHQGKYGDYEESYAEFEGVYFGTIDGKKPTKADLDSMQITREEWEADIQPIPRYVSAAEDETYGMLSLHETLEEAISAQGEVPYHGETLNVPAGIYDLDHTERGEPKRVPYRLVSMSEEAYAIICALVAPSSEDINTLDIFSDQWNELRERFPVSEFREYAEKAGEEFYS